jgi:hypothetical protein
VKVSACCLVMFLALPVTAAGGERAADLVVGHDWGSSWLVTPARRLLTLSFESSATGLGTGRGACSQALHYSRQSERRKETCSRCGRREHACQHEQLTTTFAPSCRTCEAMFVRIGGDKFRFASYLQIGRGGRVAAVNTWEEAEPKIVGLVKSVHALAAKSFAQDYNGGFVFLVMHSQELMGTWGVRPRSRRLSATYQRDVIPTSSCGATQSSGVRPNGS